MSDLPIILREPTAEDLSFMLSSFLKSHRHQGDARFMSDQVYFDHHRPRATKMFKQNVIVAVSPEDEDQIFGWIAYRHEPRDFVDDVVHYIYTKYVFRQMGVATKLWETAGKPKIVTHCSHFFELNHAKYGLTFNPDRI